MSIAVSLEKALTDARRLVERLSIREETLDALIREVTDVKLSIQSMQEYQEDTLSFSNITKTVNKGSKTPLILCLAAENKQLEQLDKQNKTLNRSLEEYQSTLDIVMTKYRLQISQLMQVNNIENVFKEEINGIIPTDNSQIESNPNESSCANGDPSNSAPILEQINKYLCQRLKHLAEGAKEAAEVSDSYTLHLEEELHKLRVENSGLRDVLNISNAKPYNMDESKTPTIDNSVTTSIGQSNRLLCHKIVAPGEENYQNDCDSDRMDGSISPRSIDMESDITVTES